ncbi:hypothetical protein SIN01_27050 [Sporolactobacillus inulinus]|nr:hypothetical protein SIN01_27050 [Sporolactobacillus inulinus]
MGSAFFDLIITGPIMLQKYPIQLLSLLYRSILFPFRDVPRRLFILLLFILSGMGKDYLSKKKEGEKRAKGIV